MNSAWRAFVRLLLLPLLLLFRTLMLLLTVGMLGFGDGMSALGFTLRKVRDPERPNQIAMVEREK